MTPAESPVSRTICLVDDDTLVLKALRRLLASAGPPGWDVRAFSEGESFLAYISSNRVDLVVLDIWMKQISGLEVLARLCSLSPWTRVIIITGRENPAVKSIAMQIGAVGFFVKPFDDEQFLAAVHQVLGSAAPYETKVP
jgi:FixJ family two-component response regulator